jgi:hypothetical protein
MNCCNDNGECTRGHGCPCGPECKVKATRDAGAFYYDDDHHAPMTAMDRLAIVVMVVACCAIVGGSFGFFYSLFK